MPSIYIPNKEHREKARSVFVVWVRDPRLSGGTEVTQTKNKGSVPCETLKVDITVAHHTLYDLYIRFIIQLSYRPSFHIRQNLSTRTSPPKAVERTPVFARLMS